MPQSADSAQSARTAPPSRKESPGRILVAEDNALNRKLFRMILEAEGYEVDLVENGREAVMAIEAAEYSLLLMDLQMPEMDGFEAARTIRKDPRHDRTPIIAVTAYLMDIGRETCMDCGMNDYLEKPFRREAIVELLRKWLHAER